MNHPIRLGLLALCLATQVLGSRASAAQTHAPEPIGARDLVAAFRVAPDAALLGAPRQAPDGVVLRDRSRQTAIGGVIGGISGGLVGVGAVALAEGYDGNPNNALIGLGVGAVVGTAVGALLGHAYTPTRTPR